MSDIRNLVLMSNSTSSALPINQTNSTEEPRAQWSVLPALFLLEFILTFTGNTFVLYICLKTRSLRTPFNLYVINLLIANISCSILQSPWDIASSLYNWTWIWGEHICNLYSYAIFVLQSAHCNCHLLICINRRWAVLFPMSYRVVHSKKIAVISCVGVWVYVHAVQLPGLVLDAGGMRAPVADYGCYASTDAHPVLDFIAQSLMFLLPVAAMIVVLPLVSLVKVARRTAIWRSATTNVVLKRISTQISTHAVEQVALPTTTASSDEGQPKNTTKKTTKTNSSQPTFSGGLQLLILLTASTVTTWLPTEIVYIITLCTSMPLEDMSYYYSITNVVFCLQPVLDPLLFTLAMPKLREAVFQTKMFRRTKSLNA